MEFVELVLHKNLYLPKFILVYGLYHKHFAYSRNQVCEKILKFLISQNLSTRNAAFWRFEKWGLPLGIVSWCLDSARSYASEVMSIFIIQIILYTDKIIFGIMWMRVCMHTTGLKQRTSIRNISQMLGFLKLFGFSQKGFSITTASFWLGEFSVFWVSKQGYRLWDLQNSVPYIHMILSWNYYTDILDNVEWYYTNSRPHM